MTLERLLELAGIKLAEDMSVDQARMVFMRAGQMVSDATDKTSLRKYWLKLQNRYNPDVGQEPDPQKMALINAAYDVLKNAPTAPANGNPADAEPYTLWGWDGRLLMPGYEIEATPPQFPQVGQTALQRMRQGFKVPRAVFLQKKDYVGSRILLINYNGQPVNPPAEFQSIGDPRRDSSLSQWLADFRV